MQLPAVRSPVMPPAAPAASLVSPLALVLRYPGGLRCLGLPDPAGRMASPPSLSHGAVLMSTLTPAQELREAAKLMRERAEAATPGPWERPLDVRHKNFVMAALPERVSVVSAAIWSIGGFMRKRSGRDLDYIASMDPPVAEALADWLDVKAANLEHVEVVGHHYRDHDYGYALKVARAYLGAGDAQ